MTIDRGNSSAKVVVWQDGEPVRSLRLFEVTIEGLLPLLEEGEIVGCAYCAVGHSDAKFLETLRRLVDGNLLVLTSRTPLPIDIKGYNRDNLGVDRVAAAVGSVALMPGESLLVVDAGTALTLDLVDCDGAYMGGNISPGLRLRFSSLHEATERLPLVTSDGETPLLGHDTMTAIRSGVMGGMTAEIERIFSKASEMTGCKRVVLTGNDAEVLMPLLEESEIPVTLNHNLVGLGLLSIYCHNLEG